MNTFVGIPYKYELVYWRCHHHAIRLAIVPILLSLQFNIVGGWGKCEELYQAENFRKFHSRTQHFHTEIIINEYHSAKASSFVQFICTNFHINENETNDWREKECGRKSEWVKKKILLYDMPYENSFASKWLGYNVRNIHFEYRK